MSNDEFSSNLSSQLSRLRTLEFWIDNLNPEFLYPELSKQSELFVQLMKALSSHLRPAPYPYGLLTLRLLGKLGGKNRRVLREPVDIVDPLKIENSVPPFLVNCAWAIPPAVSLEAMENSQSRSEGGEAVECFSLPLPLNRCVEILRLMAFSQKSDVGKPRSILPADKSFEWSDSKKLWEAQFQKIDFIPYCLDVVDKTKNTQVEAALNVLRSCLVSILGVMKCGIDEIALVDSEIPTSDSLDTDCKTLPLGVEMESSLLELKKAREAQLQTIGIGLMYGCAIDSISLDALLLLKGFYTHLFLIVKSHHKSFVRIDANGSSLTQVDGVDRTAEEVEGKESSDEPLDMFDDTLGSLKPFGYFDQTGPLRQKPNPMILNYSLAFFLTDSSPRIIRVGLKILQHVLRIPRQLHVKNPDEKEVKLSFSGMDRGSLIFFENLLYALCEKCVASNWNRREGIYESICMVMGELGVEWSRKYEMEIMHVALFSVKSVPREMASAGIRAFNFLVRVCSGLYGKPDFDTSEGAPFVWDILAITGDKEDHPCNNSARLENRLVRPCEEVLHILISEMASTKQIVRYD